LATIIFARADGAAKAAKELNGLKVDGRPMKASTPAFNISTATNTMKRSKSSSTPRLLLPHPPRSPSATAFRSPLRRLSQSQPPLLPRQPLLKSLVKPAVAAVLVEAPRVVVEVQLVVAQRPRLLRSSMRKWQTTGLEVLTVMRMLRRAVGLSNRPRTVMLVWKRTLSLERQKVVTLLLVIRKAVG
jgi:hypothetical protein